MEVQKKEIGTSTKKDKYLKYRQTHKEKLKEYSKKYRDRNREKCKELSKKWREENPGYASAYAKKKVQCPSCLKEYGQIYIKKHVCNKEEKSII